MSDTLSLYYQVPSSNLTEELKNFLLSFFLHGKRLKHTVQSGKLKHTKTSLAYTYFNRKFVSWQHLQSNAMGIMGVSTHLYVFCGSGEGLLFMSLKIFCKRWCMSIDYRVLWLNNGRPLLVYWEQELSPCSRLIVKLVPTVGWVSEDCPFSPSFLWC